MNDFTTTRLIVGDWGISDWYRMHSGFISDGRPDHDVPTTYTRHTIKEPPKVPARQAHCSCGAILIVKDNDDDDTAISAFVSKHLDGE